MHERITSLQRWTAVARGCDFGGIRDTHPRSRACQSTDLRTREAGRALEHIGRHESKQRAVSEYLKRSEPATSRPILSRTHARTHASAWRANTNEHNHKLQSPTITAGRLGRQPPLQRCAQDTPSLNTVDSIASRVSYLSSRKRCAQDTPSLRFNGSEKV